MPRLIPARINYASPGLGSSVHVFGELFKMMAGVDLVMVHYRGSFFPDLLGGQVQVTISPIRGRAIKEASVYAAIRQGKAKTGMAEELARRIKDGAIPIISDVEGFMAYYLVYAPDDTVTAISIFNNYAAAEESNRRVLAWIEQSLRPLLAEPATAMAGPVIVHTLA